MIEGNRALEMLAENRTNEVVITTMSTARTWPAISSRPELDYPLRGCMGKASSLGLGIALARPDVRVVCLDGDGSLLMNLGSLCTIATLQPRNFALVVWDNEVHMTTGGQPTATAHRSSFAGMARGAGIETVLEPGDETALGRAYDRILSEDGPFVVPVKISRGRAEGRLERDVIGYARRFRQALAAVPASR